MYHRNCWRLIGHAIRLGSEIGIDTAFSTLLLRNNFGRSPSAAAADLDLVKRTRTWFALYSHEAQMSFGDGKVPLIRGIESFAQCRRFLDHPLSTPSDVRLVALVELLALREPVHSRLSQSSVPLERDQLADMLAKLKSDLDAWYTYYDTLMADRLSMDKNSYYRESLRTQREYANLFANSLLLRDISQPRDLRQLTDDEYVLAIGAARSARVCLEIVVEGTSYPKNLPYAIPHTRLSVAFAASFLLRTGHLFPDRLDPDRTCQQVSGAVDLLEKCGTRRLAAALRFVLDRAKRGLAQKSLAPLAIGGQSNKTSDPSASQMVMPAPFSITDFNAVFNVDESEMDVGQPDLSLDDVFNPLFHPLSLGDAPTLQRYVFQSSVLSLF